ncbi:hypothetical protein [Rhizobium alvei]|uniref:Uncharacterized protein n=1 Tax=Rhizobium alvei TaxID=1132659 RepID=A0ABT8YTM5_9HYPH|nr:hypothetical protein [Rhizobium alvei]MDO6966951.1 hypothetical protein [Rhizobium alvei]
MGDNIFYISFFLLIAFVVGGAFYFSDAEMKRSAEMELECIKAGNQVISGNCVHGASK